MPASNRMSLEAEQKMLGHHWPGNIRELENCIESAVVLADGEFIDERDLPMSGAPRQRASGSSSDLADLRWEEMERLYISTVLRAHDGNRSHAAKAMGIGRTTLIRKIRTLAIEIPSKG